MPGGRPRKHKSLVGRTSGRLAVVVDLPAEKGVEHRVKCLCSCGNHCIKRAHQITSRSVSSCGCIGLGPRPVKHGHARKLTTTAEYEIWCGIKKRCLNKRNHAYMRYGGRGISICDLWRTDFTAFLAHIGPRPGPEFSIDRINNDGNYEPGNVRWATAATQGRNTSTNLTLVAFGRSQNIADWASETGIKYRTIMSRLRKGVDVETALSSPIKSRA
jgi:hypothetical protein